MPDNTENLNKLASAAHGAHNGVGPDHLKASILANIFRNCTLEEVEKLEIEAKAKVKIHNFCKNTKRPYLVL